MIFVISVMGRICNYYVFKLSHVYHIHHIHHSSDNVKIHSGRKYNLADLDKFITDDKKVNLPNEFITKLNSVSVSTTLGMMFTMFRGTILHGAVLTLINTSQYKATPREK